MPNLVPRETAHLLAFSVKEACEHSSLGRTTFYKYLKLGQIPAHKCGRRTIILLDELHQALKSLPRTGRAS
jgi:excisionase family DNA binding protein